MHWHKAQSVEVRRANATARALQALANVTTDPETSKLAKTDADYFYAKH